MPAEFKRAPEVESIAQQLIRECPDHQHLVEALAEFEEGGPLYPRHYCTRCRKQISDLETLSHDGALFHVPAKGECDGPVVRLEPGEPEPTAADQQAAS